jgi:hypothetical protein
MLKYSSHQLRRHQLRRISRSVLLTLILLLMFGERSQDAIGAQSAQNPVGNADRLAHTVENLDRKTSLIVYDPQSATRATFLTDADRTSFSFSADGRLACSAKSEGIDRIYVLDTLSAHPSPINISHDLRTNAYPLAWSRDGQHLALEVCQYDTNRLIYVWDGKKATNITPSDLADSARSFSVAWDSGERLAFTIWLRYSFPRKGDPSEIYLWDGHTTSNLSQNPTGEDRNPTWSTDGRLAFLSGRDGKYGVHVWDGASVKNGSPDVGTFANIAPDITTYYSYPAWTNKGLLAFDAYESQDEHAQIYLWGGFAATNISQNPSMHNGFPTWNADGHWAFQTFFSPAQLVYVRDTENRTILTIDGGSPAWSSSGYLAFCTFNRPEWALSMWDGKQTKLIAQGGEIWAQWQSGSRSTCSSG